MKNDIHRKVMFQKATIWSEVTQTQEDIMNAISCIWKLALDLCMCIYWSARGSKKLAWRLWGVRFLREWRFSRWCGGKWVILG